MKAKLKRTARSILSVISQKSHRSIASSYKLAKKSGLFDATWYQKRYGQFASDWLAFKDYYEKSKSCNVNPSEKFDTEAYHRRNTDVYIDNQSALGHYLKKGKFEGRKKSSIDIKWTPSNEIIPVDSPSIENLKVAVVLHIYYEDFIDKFVNSIKKFPIKVDVFVTAASEEIKTHSSSRFSALANVGLVKVALAKNQGRNFGPFLVNFSQNLLQYDLMCHLHSKKSLYSGREQTQWFDYLHQFLLKDRHVVKSALRILNENPTLGIYYPSTFWMMPTWVNNWTCNKAYIGKYAKWNVEVESNFISYPVGGMFWARPKAVEQLLNNKYTYDDFPAEPLPNDGSELHALERLLGLLAEKNGYKQLFYYPPLGSFTTDKSNIVTAYVKTPQTIVEDLMNFEVVSFDIFDTVLRRKYYEPDYAKFCLGKELTQEGLVDSPEQFIKLRNNCEHACRKSKDFVGDVDIFECYQELARQLKLPETQAQILAEREFNHDLAFSLPKDEMLEVLQQLHERGKKIWFVSDIYYTQEQIHLMLRQIGISFPYRLYVSSALGLRKDTGAMWQKIKAEVDASNKSFVHVGDNVRSDAQLCGDFGLQNLHVLNPIDKWYLGGFDKLSKFKNPSEAEILKWGPLISNFGRYPFFGD